MSMLEGYWQACGIEADTEVLEIDKMEDSIAPLDEDTAKIRRLISGFQLCYHETDYQSKPQYCDLMSLPDCSCTPPLQAKKRQGVDVYVFSKHETLY